MLVHRCVECRRTLNLSILPPHPPEPPEFEQRIFRLQAKARPRYNR